jgi:RNA polymerase sigma factor (sigma-70 family)
MEKQKFLHLMQQQSIRPLLCKILEEQLTDKEREAFMLVYIRHYKQSKAAESLGVNQARVSYLLKSARYKINNSLVYVLAYIKENNKEDKEWIKRFC